MLTINQGRKSQEAEMFPFHDRKQDCGGDGDPAMECGGHQTETNLHQDTDNGVNEEEIEDDTNQSTQMFSTLGNEVPSKRKRSVQTQNTLSTAMSSSRGLSQAQLLT